MIKTKKIAYVLFAALTLSILTLPATLTTTAKEQTIDLAPKIYEFGEKSEYEIDSKEPTTSPAVTTRLGKFSLCGDISQTYIKDGFTAYEIADDTVFSLHYTYDLSLFKASETEWHLTDDSKKTVNKFELDKKIEGGAVLLQTSFDGKKWVTGKTKTNVSGDFDFNNENGLNDIQLVNGCYYRLIVAYETEQKTKDSNVLFVDTSDYKYKKYADVYEFYAAYKEKSDENTGKKFYYNTTDYTKSTKKNDYVGNNRIDSKDPHYGWNLGSFCLSGYTDTGDTSDIYLKTVGNKIRLTYNLEQDIKKLNGNNDLEILSDKNGSDGNFQTEAHNMGHGELIIKRTDSEGVPHYTTYSNFLEALAYPGADTTIQLFEEGDYEVHLDYAINDKKGLDSKTYYRTSFSFKIRNGNCMVYVFDSQTGAELANGFIAPNGFRIDTAKSEYPKLTITKTIINDTENGLVEDTRFNMPTNDGSVYTDEGIYTVKAFNRYDEKLGSTEKTVYVGNNPKIAAYAKTQNESDENKRLSIEQFNGMINDGYTVAENYTLKAPASDDTAVSVIATTVLSTEAITETETSSVHTATDIETPEKKKSPIVPIICGVIVLAGIGGGAVFCVFKNKKK